MIKLKERKNADPYKKLLKVILISIVFYFLLYNFKTTLAVLNKLLVITTPFIIGAALAYILKIPVNFFERSIFKKLKNTKFEKYIRGFSILLALIIAVLIIVLLSSIVIPQLVESLKTLQEKLPMFLDASLNWMKKYEILKEPAADIEKYINELSINQFISDAKNYIFSENSKILSTGFNLTYSIVNGLVSFFISFVFAIYILVDKENLANQSKKLLRVSSTENRYEYMLYFFKNLDFNFHAFINGQLLDSLVIGVMTFVGMLILRLPYATMIAVVVSFLDLIPIVGPIIGIGIGVIFILIESPQQALIFVVMMLIFQQIQGNIIYPRIMGDKLNLPSLWTLFAITIGGSLLGIIGMWVLIPLFATFYKLISEYVNHKLLLEKNDL